QDTRTDPRKIFKSAYTAGNQSRVAKLESRLSAHHATASDILMRTTRNERDNSGRRG
ncbi:hypothetical protein L9F63_008130, partial [Diploptera punctata]